MKNRTIATLVLLGLLLNGCAAFLSQTQTPTEVSGPPVPLPDQTPPNIEAIVPVYPTATFEAQSMAVESPVVVAPPAQTETLAQPMVVPAAYPQTAEEVVDAFLVAYAEGEHRQMQTYLSQQQLTNLPASGAPGMAQLNGELDGFLIQSGSVSLNPPNAVVVVMLNLNGGQTIRVFQLVQENGVWKIESVDIARG